MRRSVVGVRALPEALLPDPPMGGEEEEMMTYFALVGAGMVAGIAVAPWVWYAVNKYIG
jgi:hypothetical protein